MTKPTVKSCGHIIEAQGWSRDDVGWDKRSTVNIMSAQDLNLTENVIIIHASANAARNCGQCRARLDSELYIPGIWWSDYCKNSNGYFGSQTTRNARNDVTGVVSWSLSLVKQVGQGGKYDWYKQNVFVNWSSYGVPSPRTKILILDAPDTLPGRIPSLLFKGLDGHLLASPYWAHARLFEEIVAAQDNAVWGIRTAIRTMELSREQSGAPNYGDLHNVARHAIHVSETLDVAIITMESMLRQHTSLMEIHPDLVPSGCISNTIQDKLLFLKHMLESLRCRSSSNKDRLNNEIQLTFNVEASKEVKHSHHISQAARADSQAMKTIAFATSIFLPATFISALFSMSFFSFDVGGAGWKMADEVWIYFAFAVPFTLFAMVGWWRFGKVRDDRGPSVMGAGEEKG